MRERRPLPRHGRDLGAGVSREREALHQLRLHDVVGLESASEKRAFKRQEQFIHNSVIHAYITSSVQN